jgi:5'-3' exonuclease
VASWGWFYPHLYAPLASDLVDLPSLEPTCFAAGRPFTPLMQLLSVLPSASGRHLPGPYRQLMVNEDSPLKSFFPSDFEVDSNGKRNTWEAVVKIPFLDEGLMVNALNCIDHLKELTPQERLRNINGKEYQYFSKDTRANSGREEGRDQFQRPTVSPKTETETRPVVLSPSPKKKKSRKKDP